MKKRKLKLAAAALFLAAVAGAAPKTPAKTAAGARPAPGAQQPAAVKPPAEEPAAITGQVAAIRKGLLESYVPVTGVTTAHESFDVLAPFDGRVEEVRSELFGYVTPATVLGRMVSNEMAALLDSSPEGSKAQTEKRWKDVFKYYDIKPEAPGVVTNVYASPRTQVYKGDRLFTVSKKIIVIGRNTKKHYTALEAGMTAEVENFRTGEKFPTVLANHLPLRGSRFFSRLWLDVADLRAGIKVGAQYDGRLLLGRNPDARIVPRRDVLQVGGKKYLLLEVRTGLTTEDETEITGIGDSYLRITSPDKDVDDVKPEK